MNGGGGGGGASHSYPIYPGSGGLGQGGGLLTMGDMVDKIDNQNFRIMLWKKNAYLAKIAIRRKNAQSAAASKANMRKQQANVTQGLKNSAVNRQQSNGGSVYPFGIQSNLLPVAKAVGLDVDFQIAVGGNVSVGGIHILQGPDAGRIVLYTDLGVGAGLDVSGSLKETNIFFTGDINDFTIEALRGNRMEYSGAVTINGVDVSGGFFQSIDLINGGRVFGISVGVGVGAFPYWISGGSNFGTTTIYE